MIRSQPMATVDDVEAASRWFQQVVGLVSAHGGDEYEMLMSDDQLVLQLHHWDADEHPHLGDRDDPSRGNGLLLWFATDAFDEVVSRAEEHGAEIIDGPLHNPLAHHRELWLRGPDGYTVVVAGA